MQVFRHEMRWFFIKYIMEPNEAGIAASRDSRETKSRTTLSHLDSGN